MATTERAIDRGSRQAHAARAALGEELRRARVQRGLSQGKVGSAAGMSRMQVSRIERAVVAELSISALCRLSAVLGLHLSIKVYPDGDPLRDEGHAALLARAVAKIKCSGRWSREVPLPIPGDLRAWDAILETDDGRVALEAETRLADLQALQRRLARKKRDDPGVGSVILVVGDTRHNRRILAQHGAMLKTDYPLNEAALLSILEIGLVPPRNGMMLA